MKEQKRKKSELHSRDRYEVANEMESNPATKKQLYLVVAFIILIVIAIPAIGWMSRIIRLIFGF